MKSTGITRHIDGLGRFVIPKELRDTYNLKQGSPMEIFINDGEITLRNSADLCVICGADTELKQVKSKKICPCCLSDLIDINT